MTFFFNYQLSLEYTTDDLLFFKLINIVELITFWRNIALFFVALYLTAKYTFLQGKNCSAFFATLC